MAGIQPGLPQAPGGGSPTATPGAPAMYVGNPGLPSALATAMTPQWETHLGAGAPPLGLETRTGTPEVPLLGLLPLPNLFYVVLFENQQNQTLSDSN